MPKSPAPSAAAWSFVLEHTTLIERAARYACPRHVDVEAFRQELMIYVARRHHSYDPSKSGPSTWIGWQARHTRDELLRGARKAARDRSEGRAWHAVANAQAAHRNCVETIDRCLEVSRILDAAGTGHRDAALSVLAGHTRFEVPDVLGVSYQARDGRLRRLGKHFPDYAA